MDNNSAILWFEIPVTDLQRARKFYEGIFEIEMAQLNINENLSMALFPSPGGTTGGALCLNKANYVPSREGCLVYLNANPDLKKILEKVEPNGGKILRSKTFVSPQWGYMALIEDTEGNRIALKSSE